MPRTVRGDRRGTRSGRERKKETEGSLSNPRNRTGTKKKIEQDLPGPVEWAPLIAADRLNKLSAILFPPSIPRLGAAHNRSLILFPPAERETILDRNQTGLRSNYLCQPVTFPLSAGLLPGPIYPGGPISLPPVTGHRFDDYLATSAWPAPGRTFIRTRRIDAGTRSAPQILSIRRCLNFLGASLPSIFACFIATPVFAEVTLARGTAYRL